MCTYHTAPDPSRWDIPPRSKNVEPGSKVADVSHAVGLVARTHRANERLRRGAVVSYARALISGRHAHKDAGINKSLGRGVDGSAEGPAYGDIGRSTGRAAARGLVRGDKVHALNHGARGAAAVVGKDFHAQELGLLGHTVSASADNAGQMRTVTVAVSARTTGVGEIGNLRSAAAKVWVRSVDAGVNHVGAGPHARGGVVRIGRFRTVVALAVGYADEAPGRRRLGRIGLGVEYRIVLYELDLLFVSLSSNNLC